MRALVLLVLVLVLAPSLRAADFGHPGGPPVAGSEELVRKLQQDPYDLELMLSFGTSKVGSGGHIALAVKGEQELVYSANFYADRSPAHAEGHFTRDLMCIIPKHEYLFGTASTISGKASFGLDFGEVFKRSVIGLRVFGVPAAEKQALVAFFHRLNADYARDAASTEYHERRILYGYMDLNCAKTVGAAFRWGAGYEDLKIKGTGVLAKVNPFKALKANIPMEMAMKLVAAWGKRGYRMDSVLYRKFEHSTYADPHDAGQSMFRDLPNRFPSYLGLDYAEDDTSYEDFDNLYAMNLINNLSRHAIVVDPATRAARIESSREPMPLVEAVSAARDAASRDSKLFVRQVFHAWGIRIGRKNDNTRLARFECGEAPVEEP